MVVKVVYNGFILMSEYMFYLAAISSTLGLSDPVSSTINFFDSMQKYNLLAYTQ